MCRSIIHALTTSRISKIIFGIATENCSTFGFTSFSLVNHTCRDKSAEVLKTGTHSLYVITCNVVELKFDQSVRVTTPIVFPGPWPFSRATRTCSSVHMFVCEHAYAVVRVACPLTQPMQTTPRSHSHCITFGYVNLLPSLIRCDPMAAT